MVAGGEIQGTYTNVVEIIDLESPSRTCQNLQNFPHIFKLPAGGLLSNGNPVVCGGDYGSGPVKTCFSYQNTVWSALPSMTWPRQYPAVSKSPYLNASHRFLVAGGIGGINTGEILTDSGWQSLSSPLPVSIFGHCMAHVNSTTVLIAGGFQNYISTAANTYFFNTEKETWTAGPVLKLGRDWCRCGGIRKDYQSTDYSTIVVGGISSNGRESTSEILDAGSSEWVKGPELPLGIASPSLVEYHNGGVVLLAGDSDFALEKTIYYLEHARSSWIKMPQALKIGRQSALAFLVPDEITNCS